MARIRSVKPEFWADRKLARLSRDARLLYIALWNQSDEHSRLQGDARYIKGHCFPYDDDLSLGDVASLLDELERHGRIVRYDVDGDPYLFLPKLAEHQRLEPHKQQSRLPEPPSGADSPAPTDNNPTPSADLSEPRAERSAPRADSSEPIVVQQVAGSRLQVAGSRVGETPTAPRPARTEGQRAEHLTKIYTSAVPLSAHLAVKGVVLKALKAGSYTDERLSEALSAMAADRRPVSAATLLVELEGHAPSRKRVGDGKIPWTEADYMKPGIFDSAARRAAGGAA